MLTLCSYQHTRYVYNQVHLVSRATTNKNGKKGLARETRVHQLLESNLVGVVGVRAYTRFSIRVNKCIKWQAPCMAVKELQKIIGNSEIRIRGEVDLNRFWHAIIDKDGRELKEKGWIINNTLETVRFYVYNSDDRIRWIYSQKVDAQPGEIIEVQGGLLQKADEHMVVYKDNRGTAYNIKKNHMHCWTGSAMYMIEASTVESFRNQYSHRNNQSRRNRRLCCCMYKLSIILL